MSDTDIPAEGTSEIVPGAPAETPAADSEPVEQTTPPAAEGQPQETDKPSTAAPGEQGKPQEQAKPQAPQPPMSRRSAKYRIEQLARENAELRKQNGLPAKAAEQPDEGEPQPTDPQPQPDVAKLVEQEVAKRLNPVMSENSRAADDAEINELFTGSLATQKAEFEPKIREAWKLPQYKDLSAADLYKVLTYDAELAKAKLAAVEEFKKAGKEAKESSGSGTSARKDGKEKTAWDLSEEELKKVTDRARSSG